MEFDWKYYEPLSGLLMKSSHVGSSYLFSYLAGWNGDDAQVTLEANALKITVTLGPWMAI